ncbi:CocE/NonD family hydrolase [Jiangella anatolica]|uniref:Xaa-Pro dipeptidyl-peptidase C-terminal domain-containing protein n=1 Tax=Jiangella anatolica TaxID=2670374 RepID=A0A2W2C2E1_9ACTN|nr:CocE/NonD family hydrolase [Jiangella anatolica]PZF82359.1 hypothetical protein C1I92_17185 [Jiangella anatolica]
MTGTSASRFDTYVAMPDGVRLAVTAHVPASATASPVPAVIRATRYWRGRPPGVFAPRGGEAAAFTDAGFALVLVDVRGTGASFGRWDGPWSPSEVADLGALCEWVAAQPWSNGRVGSHGVSYDGNTAELIAAAEPPSLRAIIPRFSDVDPFIHLSFPGGILLDSFIQSWAAGNQALDRMDPEPVMALTGETRDEVMARMGAPDRADEDVDGSLLAAALAEHAGNLDVWAVGSALTFADDASAKALRVVESSPHHLRHRIERSGVAIQAWASWFDAGTAAGALSRFNNIGNPMAVLIGPWSHGAAFDASLTGDEPMPAAVTPDDQAEQMFGFLHENLDAGARGTTTRSIRFWQLFADRWCVTEQWPPHGSGALTLYCGPDGALVEAPIAEGADAYRVDFTTTTGPANRWATQSGGGPVIYPDRREAGERCLTYTTAPLTEAVDIIGDPVVTLHLESSTPDSALYVYLEAVTPDGEVRYLTEGQLRLLHRRTSPAPPGEWHAGPYRTFHERDAAPLERGEVAEIALALLPLAARIDAGWRLRIAIAGADAGTFVRIPATGTPTFTVHRSASRPSSVQIPVVPTLFTAEPEGESVV